MISQGLQDYIEYIYWEISKGKELRAVDISKKFNFSRASVSEALNKLSELNLIIYETRKPIKITQKGILEAEKILTKHQILTIFFNEILGEEINLASKNACRIEHCIDDELIKKLKNFNTFCKKENFHKKFKEKLWLPTQKHLGNF